MNKITVNEDICKGCGLCVEACPKKIIKLSENRLNAKGYKPAEAEDCSECIGCAFCATVCPDVAIRVFKGE